MRTSRRPAVVIGVTAASALLLGGCSAIEAVVGGGEDPVRDATTGEVTASTTSDAFQLRVGDCLDLSDAEEVETVPLKPCEEPHDGEVYAATLLPDGEFPGDEAVFASAEEHCLGEFEAFVGAPYDTSAIDFDFFVPSQDSWKYLEDREILCIAFDMDGQVTGSLQGVAR